MSLLIHIIIAFLSLLYTAYTLISPSRSKLRVSYALVALTLTSGTYLVWSTQTHMLQACVSGLVYLSVVFFGIAIARRKLSNVVPVD